MNGTPAPNLLATARGRRWLFAVLYLSEGAPVGFVWWAMPTLLRQEGIGLAAITTMTSLATLPWVLKFLVGPLLDAGLARGVSIKRWIVVCQLAMAAALVPLALLDWSAQFGLVVAVVVAHALFAAVQDVGIDTLAIHAVPREELGRVNGWMQAGMLLGRASVAAGATALAARLGDPGAVAPYLALVIALPLVVLLVAVHEPVIRAARVSLTAVARRLVTRVGLAGLATALLIGAGFEFFGVSAGPRLVDLGASEGTVALFFALFAPAGLALGALAGGRLADRFGTLRCTVASLVGLTAVLLAIAGAGRAVEVAGSPLPAFALVYLGIGALTATSYTLFMTLARGDFAATRFTAFMAMTNGCEAWSGYVGGRFAERDYGLTLAALSLVACLAAVPLYALGRLGVHWRGSRPKAELRASERRNVSGE